MCDYRCNSCLVYDSACPEHEEQKMAHPSIEAVRQFFTFEHLPAHLKPVSEACSELADLVVDELKLDGPEATTGLRKLLEAKDCFVRAAVVSARTPAKITHPKDGCNEDCDKMSSETYHNLHSFSN